MLQMYNVSKIYSNGVKALSDVTFRIHKGEFVFLVGASGAGKSTMIKLITREEVPNRGQIMFDQKNISRMKNSEIPFLRRKIGVIFQDFRLLPNKTVFDNIAFALQVMECSKREIERAVPKVLKSVGLQSKAEQFPTQLSGGEQQRVAIARAIVNNPRMIIADEPTGNLDPDTSKEIMDLLLDINMKGTTIVMATHDRDTVDRLRKRVIELKNGAIVRDEEKGEYGLEAEDNRILL